MCGPAKVAFAPPRPRQFGLRGLLIVVTCAAFGMALVRLLGPGIVCRGAAWVTLMLLLLWVVLGAIGGTNRE